MIDFFALMLIVQLAFSFITIRQLRSQPLVEQMREVVWNSCAWQDIFCLKEPRNFPRFFQMLLFCDISTCYFVETWWGGDICDICNFYQTILRILSRVWIMSQSRPISFQKRRSVLRLIATSSGVWFLRFYMSAVCFLFFQMSQDCEISAGYFVEI